MRRLSEKSTQKWKNTLMYQWPLGTSLESPARGGEHVILLSLPIEVMMFFHVVWVTAQPVVDVCGGGLAQIWPTLRVLSLSHLRINSIISVLLNNSYPPSPPHWYLFIFRLMGNKSKVILLLDYFPLRRKSLFLSAVSYLYYVTSDIATFQEFH